jgi:hypothetical protein
MLTFEHPNALRKGAVHKYKLVVNSAKARAASIEHGRLPRSIWQCVLGKQAKGLPE